MPPHAGVLGSEPALALNLAGVVHVTPRQPVRRRYDPRVLEAGACSLADKPLDPLVGVLGICVVERGAPFAEEVPGGRLDLIRQSSIGEWDALGQVRRSPRNAVLAVGNERREMCATVRRLVEGETLVQASPPSTGGVREDARIAKAHVRIRVLEGSLRNKGRLTDVARQVTLHEQVRIVEEQHLCGLRHFDLLRKLWNGEAKTGQNVSAARAYPSHLANQRPISSYVDSSRRQVW